jgi:hypothetical protein
VTLAIKAWRDAANLIQIKNPRLRSGAAGPADPAVVRGLVSKTSR